MTQTTASPPSWAELVLRAFVDPRDVDSVSGDLLEEYREHIHPVYGRRRADVWYLRQVVGFLPGGVRVAGMLLGVAAVVRDAVDWLAPPADFHTRAAVSTYLALALLAGAGFVAARRSGSHTAGPLAGVAAAIMGALISIVGATGLLMTWNDPQTMEAIARSGGVGEVFTLPFVMMPVGILLGTLGGVAGAAARHLR